MSHWWSGYFVPDSGHHSNWVKQVSFSLANTSIKCNNQNKSFHNRNFVLSCSIYVKCLIPITIKNDTREVTFMGFTSIKILLAHVALVTVRWRHFNRTIAETIKQNCSWPERNTANFGSKKSCLQLQMYSKSQQWHRTFQFTVKPWCMMLFLNRTD